jgi:hypothetical protein
VRLPFCSWFFGFDFDFFERSNWRQVFSRSLSARIKIEKKIYFLKFHQIFYQILAKTLSETACPMEREDVAAGDGALQTLIALLFSMIEKSSSKPPS